jgi:hypothetical protein
MSIKYLESINSTSLTLTFDTGCNPAVNVVAKLEKFDDRVKIYIPAILSAAGLAASIASTTTALPVEYRPARTTYFICPVIDNAANAVGAICFQTTGIINYYSSIVALAAFTPGAGDVGTPSDQYYEYSTV